MVDGELLAQRQPVVRVGGPPSQGEPVERHAVIDDCGIRPDVDPAPRVQPMIAGEVRGQRAAGTDLRGVIADGCQVVQVETVEEVDVRGLFHAVPGYDDGLDDDLVGGQIGDAADARGPLRDPEQVADRSRVVGGRLAALSEALVLVLRHGLGEGHLGLWETVCPRGAPRAGVLDAGDRPQCRGQHRRVRDGPSVLVDQQPCARTAPTAPLVVRVLVRAEHPVQPLIGGLQIVDAQVHRVLPDPCHAVARLGRRQSLPGRGIPGRPSDDSAVVRVRGATRQRRDPLRVEQLHHPPEPQEPVLLVIDPRKPHADHSERCRTSRPPIRGAPYCSPRRRPGAPRGGPEAPPQALGRGGQQPAKAKPASSPAASRARRVMCRCSSWPPLTQPPEAGGTVPPTRRARAGPCSGSATSR